MILNWNRNFCLWLQANETHNFSFSWAVSDGFA